VWAGIWLALAVALIPAFGAAGLAASSLGAWGIALLIYIAMARRLLAAREMEAEPEQCPVSVS